MNLNQLDSKKNPSCPQPAVLKEFLQGLLEPPELDDCESHVADCQTCHETLRGLNSDDTLSQYVAQAIQAKQKDPEVSGSDSQQVAGLIEKLLDPATKHGSGIHRPADAEILADRAAEVLRYLDPVEGDSKPGEAGLGKLDNYLLYRLIGAGSTGVVFHAIDQSLNRNVALKVLRPSLGSVARERFIAEAKLAASIEHPNVVTIYQVGSRDRLAYIAMQWLPGQTLEQRLLESELDEAEIRQVVSQIAGGLSAAHQKQLVHRDIKPANIWISEESGDVKILDFGLARIADDDPGLTATGMLAGTPNFMSPEQTRGLELDGRSDLFSLGCILYRLLTGRLPYGAPTVLATLQSIQNEHPEPPQTVQAGASPDLSDLTMCLLEKQPNNRPDSATQLAQMLESPRDQWPRKVASYASAANAGSAEASSIKHGLDSSSRAPVKQARPSGGNWIRWATLVGLLLLGFFGCLFAPQIVRIATDQGEIVINSSDEDVSIRVSRDGNLITVLDTATSNSFNIASGKYEIEAVRSGDSDSSTSENSFRVSPNSFTMKRGSQTIVTVSQVPIDSQRVAAKIETQPNSNALNAVGQSPAIYNGRTFEQWLDIANRDRDPKTSGNAMLACSRLAESESDVSALRSVIKKLARQYGSYIVGASNEADVMREKLLKSLSSRDPEFVIDFALQELESGNSKSRGFCVWLTKFGSIYDGFGDQMYELHQEAIIKKGDSLLAAALRMDLREDFKAGLIRSICRNLYPKKSQTNPFGGQGLFDKAEIQRLNPNLFQWVREKYESCLPDSIAKKSLGHLATEYFANDKDFLAQNVGEMFDPETEPATREILLELITGWDTSPDLQATILLLMLENQFPHTEDRDHHKWLESIFDDLSPGYSTSRFASSVPLKFESDLKRTYGWNYGGYTGNHGGPKLSRARHSLTRAGVIDSLNKADGTTAVVRFLVSKLWSVEPLLSPEYKKNVLLTFLSKWMSINNIEAIYSKEEFEKLQIATDVQQLIEMIESGESREAVLSKGKLSEFVTKFYGFPGGGGVGGSGGGGIF